MKLVDGEILTIDDGINRLYDYHNEDYWLVPLINGDITDNVFLALHYVPDDADGDYDAYDEFYDVFGCVVFRDSWIVDYGEWVIVSY